MIYAGEDLLVLLWGQHNILDQEESYQALYGLALKSFLAFFTNQQRLQLFSDLSRERILFQYRLAAAPELSAGQVEK